MRHMSSLAATQSWPRLVLRLPSCKYARCAGGGHDGFAVHHSVEPSLSLSCSSRLLVRAALTKVLMGWECLQPGKGRSCRQPGKLVLPGEVSVSIEAGLKEKELLEALQPLKDERLLMFTDMRQAFGGFSNPKDAERCASHINTFAQQYSLQDWCNMLKVATAHRGHMLLCVAGVPAGSADFKSKEKLQCVLCGATSGQAAYVHTGLRSD